MTRPIGEVRESSSSVVDAVEDLAVKGRLRSGKGSIASVTSRILDGSPCTGCVTIGTGGGTGSGRGVGKSIGVTGLKGAVEIPCSVPEPSPWSRLKVCTSSKLDDARRSFPSIRNLLVPKSADFRRDPFRVLVFLC